MAAPSLATESAASGAYPAFRFGQRERKLLASVQAYVDAQVLAAAYVVATPADTSDWTSTDPTTLNSAMNRLISSYNDLLTKLDADAGVTDTNYKSLLTP